MHIKVAILLYVNYITINLTLKKQQTQKNVCNSYARQAQKKYILPNISTELFN